MALPGMQAPAPEWPVAVSGKFTDKLHGRELGRRPVDAFAKHGAEHGLARNGFGSYFADTGGLAPTQGLRAVPHLDGGEVHAWRPSKRTLTEPGALHYERAEGRRLPERVPSQKVFTICEKRHLRQVESKEEISDRPVGPKNVFRENGLRARDQPAREVDISTEMARKVRPLDLESQRNNIGCRALGDKNYRHPEYDAGFHAAGGLIIGSTGVRGHFKKTEPRNAASVHLVLDNTKRSVKSYEEKYREQQLSEAQAEVEQLTRSWEAGALRECAEAAYQDLDSEDEAPAAGS